MVADDKTHKSVSLYANHLKPINERNMPTTPESERV